MSRSNRRFSRRKTALLRGVEAQELVAYRIVMGGDVVELDCEMQILRAQHANLPCEIELGDMLVVMGGRQASFVQKKLLFRGENIEDRARAGQLLLPHPIDRVFIGG